MGVRSKMLLVMPIFMLSVCEQAALGSELGSSASEGNTQVYRPQWSLEGLCKRGSEILTLEAAKGINGCSPRRDYTDSIKAYDKLQYTDKVGVILVTSTGEKFKRYKSESKVERDLGLVPSTFLGWQHLSSGTIMYDLMPDNPYDLDRTAFECKELGLALPSSYSEEEKGKWGNPATDSDFVILEKRAKISEVFRDMSEPWSRSNFRRLVPKDGGVMSYASAAAEVAFDTVIRSDRDRFAFPAARCIGGPDSQPHPHLGRGIDLGFNSLVEF